MSKTKRNWTSKEKHTILRKYLSIFVNKLDNGKTQKIIKF